MKSSTGGIEEQQQWQKGEMNRKFIYLPHPTILMITLNMNGLNTPNKSQVLSDRILKSKIQYMFPTKDDFKFNDTTAIRTFFTLDIIIFIFRSSIWLFSFISQILFHGYVAFLLPSEYMEHIYSSWFLMSLSVSSIIDMLFVSVSIDFFLSRFWFTISCFFACLVVFFCFCFLIRYQTLWIILLVARFHCVPLNTIIFFSDTELLDHTWIFSNFVLPFFFGVHSSL